MKLQKVIALVFVLAFVAIVATACFPPDKGEPSVGDKPKITADMASPAAPHPVDGPFADCMSCHADAKAAHDKWEGIWDESKCASCHQPAAAAPQPEPQPEPAPAEPTEATEGELLGEGNGFGGPIKVKVVMDGDKISAVEVLSHGETAGISDPAFSTIPAAIVSAQSADVDVAAGATMSSKGIMEAVKQALASKGDAPTASAGGSEYTGEGAGFGGPIKVKVAMDGDKISAVEVLSHGETPGISDPAFSTIPAAIVKAQSADVDVAAGCTMSSKGIMEAVKNALANVSAAAPTAAEPAAPASGSSVLEGEGAGFGGAIKVKVTMDGDTISAVEVVSHGETPGISDPAFSTVPAAIVKAQSADVDAASGATMSSNGIKEAVKNALSKK